MTQKAEVAGLDTNLEASSRKPMQLVGELSAGKTPMERFQRVHEAPLSTPRLLADPREARAYSERLKDCPYDEIVFVLEGAMSIVDEDVHDERFETGDCFFLQRGFNGYWNQPRHLKIFHMTVVP